MRRAPWLAAAALAGATLAPRAGAQPSLDVRTLRPPADPRGGIVQEPTSTVGNGVAAMGLLVAYSYRPVVLELDGEVAATPVEHQLTADALFTLGIGRRTAAWLRVPAVVVARGDDLASVLPDAAPLPTTALGDAAAGAKATLLATNDRRRPGVAATAEITAPTGNDRSFLGEGAPTVIVHGLLERTGGAWTWRAQLGPRLRLQTGEYLGTELGHELDWALGTAIHPAEWGIDRRRRWELHADLHGAVALTPELLGDRRSPALASLAARCRITDVSVLGGAEVPLDSALGVPLVRGVLAVAWAPRFYDADTDGIPDDRDRCVDSPEDRDGFADQDGCADLDDDRDGVRDDADGCRAIAEDRDGTDDADGCPDPDNDHDGVPDGSDVCPHERGAAAERGCPVVDADGDGISDDHDWCPAREEDPDGFQDDDGCPDLDDDGDGIPDSEDSCPREPGTHRAGAERYGCPAVDRDGDTFDDGFDACPDAAEDFDGRDDDDGCPEVEATPRVPRAAPLVTLEPATPPAQVRWQRPPRLRRIDGALAIEAASLPAVRALAQLLNEHPRWVAIVSAGPTDEARAEAEALATALRELCHRDSAARSEAAAEAGGTRPAPGGGPSVRVVELPAEEGAP